MGRPGSRTLKRTIKGTLAGTAARLVRRPAITPAALVALRPAGVIIVRQHNQMGDMICATPAFRALRETYPQARLTLVTAPVNAEVVAGNPHLDRILTFDRAMWRRPGRLAGFLRDLRAGRPEVAFVLSSVSFSVTSAAIALASGARWVVGADSVPFGWDVSRHAFSLEMPAQPRLQGSAVAHSLAPLQAIGITTADLDPVVVPTPQDTAAAGEILREFGLADGFWVMHPGAGKPQNVWPAGRFAAVAGMVAAAGGRVLVLHGPADGPAVRTLRAALAADLQDRILLAPPCSVGVGAALLRRCERFLCNDTGIMHVAGALGVPTLALFGPTDPALWKPPSARVRALRSPVRLPDPRGEEYGWMEGLEVARVWAAWSALPAAAISVGNEGK